MKNAFKKQQSNVQFQMHVEIKTKAGAVLKPTEIKFWNQSNSQHPKSLENTVPNTPFKFYSDAILGLCFHKLTDYKYASAADKDFAVNAYRCFDSYTELFHKSAPRVQSLKNPKVNVALACENFEKKVTAVWENAFNKDGVYLTKFAEVVDLISDFEEEISAPIIYNFNVKFSEGFSEKLLCFYTMLFNLRSIIAVDYNAHAEDSSVESVHCDSITDYLPKADYTANDALIYWNFKKLSQPFVAHKDKDVRVEKLFVEPLAKHFHQYNHNACALVDQLPSSFLNSLSHGALEEALHHVQMDWLLGSDSGLMFKLREEIYGVITGYDKIFWHHCSEFQAKKASSLSLCFELSDADLNQSGKAA